MAKLMRSGAAAEALGIHQQSLQRWARAGRIRPAMRLPDGEYRWDLDDLKRQLDVASDHDQAPVPESRKPQLPAVIAAIVTSRLGVLAGRRNDGQPPWGFITGESEPGESPADTAAREVKEETGLLIRPGDTIGQRVHPKTGRLLVYIAARPGTHNKEIHVGDPDELAEVAWLPLEDADRLLPAMFPPVRQHLARVLRATSARRSSYQPADPLWAPESRAG